MYSRKLFILITIIVLSLSSAGAQKLEFLIKDLNASGGVTVDKNGNLYVSDFGPKLGSYDTTTNVYKVNIQTKEVAIFATGFRGASGACFDSKGNFYQSNPFGHSISKVKSDGSVDHSFITEGLKTPIGLTVDSNDNIYVCNCGGNSIGKFDTNGNYVEFATSDLFRCPNGLTKDNEENLYSCNFNDGKVLKINKTGEVSVFAELPFLGGEKPVGNGHLTYVNGSIYVATIGKGEIYRLDQDGNVIKVIGIPLAFINYAGGVNDASLCKPNGIAASPDGKSLYINVSDAPWNSKPLDLHPAHVMVLTGFEKE